MKWILVIILTVSMSGCVALGTFWVHSPNAAEGKPGKYSHVHGGVTQKSPPDFWTFYLEDSTTIVVQAQKIAEKTNFAGIGLPIIPLFWLPKKKYYRRKPQTLIIRVFPDFKSKYHMIFDSTRVISNQQSYPLDKFIKTEQAWELEFSLNAAQTLRFELVGLQVQNNGKIKNLPIIKFCQRKQRWGFMGP